jgi:hypothetical protein
MTHLIFLQVQGPVFGLLPIVLFILIAFLVYKRILISVKKEISEFKQTMDKPTFNGQLMFKSGECLINLFKWGLIGTIISTIFLILEGPFIVVGGLIALFTAVYMFSRTIAIAYYLKGGKSE